MKILKYALALLFLSLIGGFAVLAFTEVPVPQQEVSKTIPADKFLGN